MNVKYKNACTELIALFDFFLSEDDYNKIPKEQIEFIKQNSNKDYKYNIDETKSLEEQELSKEAKAMIISLYKKYFADENENKKIDEILVLNDRVKKEEDLISDKEKRKKYRQDDLFQKNGREEKTIQIEKKEMVERKENLFSRVINAILKFFHIR